MLYPGRIVVGVTVHPKIDRDVPPIIEFNSVVPSLQVGMPRRALARVVLNAGARGAGREAGRVARREPRGCDVAAASGDVVKGVAPRPNPGPGRAIPGVGLV